MGVVLVAFDILRARDALAFPVHPSAPAIFAWLVCAGVLGALAAWPLREHYIEREKLPFAAGAAAGETILALEGKRARPSAAALAFSLAAATGFTCLRPVGWTVGPLGVGSGMLVGLRVAASMLAGWLAARAMPAGLVPWLAASVMVAGGVASAVPRVPALAAAVRAAFVRGRGAMAAGAAAAVALLCLVDRYALGLSVGLTLASVAIAGPLLLVGTRVLGETNWAPVLSLAAVAQVALAAIAPGCLVTTVVGGAVAGAIPNGGQHMMQSFRAAAIVGARARDTVSRRWRASWSGRSRSR
jgi:uncharacterized oligopeptide transporter (OPT) family protein